MAFDIALIGFGEAALSFASAGRWKSRATAFDIKTVADDAASAGKRADYRAAGVIGAESACKAVALAKLVLSLVTADQAVTAAGEAASGLLAGAVFCDGNSVAPETKRATARIVESAGALYVDMAILAPVIPRQLKVPILLSGGAANRACSALVDLGFGDVRVCGGQVGRASSIKMIRSVMVKGIEALTVECLLAASQADVLAEVLQSLDASDLRQSWAERADYNLDRVLVHGLRRAAEMREVAKTLTDLGQRPEMTRGAIVHQQALGALGFCHPPAGLEAKLAAIQTAIHVKGRSAA